MPRIHRYAPGGLIYHVLNRGTGRQTIFETPDDYAAFLRVFVHALQHEPVPVLAYCIMPNHWHLVLWPHQDGQLPRFMQRLTVTHVRRWIEHRHRVGWGVLYQGRYRSSPLQDDPHLTTVLRYVERNPVRAGLVQRAQDWPWSSLGQAHRAHDDHIPLIPLAHWPIPRRADWIDWVNQPQTPAEEQALRLALTTGRPYGSDTWVQSTCARLALPPSRPRGRPTGRALLQPA